MALTPKEMEKLIKEQEQKAKKAGDDDVDRKIAKEVKDGAKDMQELKKLAKELEDEPD
jgi:hypothetical protein